jgi:hypothetical protein
VANGLQRGKSGNRKMSYEILAIVQRIKDGDLD